MRSLLLSSILAVTISCTAYAKPVAHPPKAAAHCATVSDLNEILAAKGGTSLFAPVPKEIYDTFAAKTSLPTGAVGMVAAVVGSGMIVAPLDAKGCALASATFTAKELNELFGTKAPAASPQDKAPDGQDRV
jgi:hypothetical protein